MIPCPSPVFVATRPVDMRRGHDGLAALTREYAGRDVIAGSCFLFFNRRVDRVKALWWDGTGYVLLYKRIERGYFRVPQALCVGATSVEIDAGEVLAILEGVPNVDGSVDPGEERALAHRHRVYSEALRNRIGARCARRVTGDATSRAEGARWAYRSNVLRLG
ncbi:MAG: IS66 family insertion sequence element accessory protein TnpB [Myxococcota bacterium]